MAAKKNGAAQLTGQESLHPFHGILRNVDPSFLKHGERAELNSSHARNYLRGLLSETQRKNSETIADGIDGANVQDLQNFIADSKWDDAVWIGSGGRRR